jgi:hypothetical protein
MIPPRRETVDSGVAAMLSGIDAGQLAGTIRGRHLHAALCAGLTDPRMTAYLDVGTPDGNERPDERDEGRDQGGGFSGGSCVRDSEPPNSIRWVVFVCPHAGARHRAEVCHSTYGGDGKCPAH